MNAVPFAVGRREKLSGSENFADGARLNCQVED